MISSSTISLVVGLPGDLTTRRQYQELNEKCGAVTNEALPLINGYTVDVPEDQLDTYLAALPESATVMVNEPFQIEPPHERSHPKEKSLPEREKISDGDEESSSRSQIRDDDERTAERAQGPVVDPHATHPLGWDEVRAQGLDGSGVTLAVIDSGLFPHPDFGNRIKAFKNFSWQGSAQAHDDYGHGTHVAGIAAGDGELIDGVAPKLGLVGARILSPSEAIKAIDWVIAHKEEYGIDILNLSLGSPAVLPGRQDPFAQATQRAIDAGILTVVAAGNEAKNGTVSGTISTPGILQDAITVGAYNDGRTADLDDDKMWGDSSLGPTKPEGLAKPDLIAPGAAILAASASGAERPRTLPSWNDYHLDWGTSMATPMVAGALALMLQANSQLTQRAAKEILQKTAIPLEGVDTLAQGAGRLNLLAAVEQARQWTPS